MKHDDQLILVHYLGIRLQSGRDFLVNTADDPRQRLTHYLPNKYLARCNYTSLFGSRWVLRLRLPWNSARNRLFEKFTAR